MLGEYEKAFQAFSTAVTINSTYSEAWYNMGVIFDLVHDNDSAMQAYDRAIGINPSYQKVIINRDKDMDIIANIWPNWENCLAQVELFIRS
jgi:tetratricopeptide (TPR) repeat protein